MEINLSELKNKKEIKFNIEMSHQIYNQIRDAMYTLVEDTDILKKIYKELSPEEIKQIFLGEKKVQSMVSSGDVLNAICDMNGVDFMDNDIKELDNSQHHGKKAKADIQKEKELAIKDLEGPQVTGPSGPGR